MNFSICPTSPCWFMVGRSLGSCYLLKCSLNTYLEWLLFVSREWKYHSPVFLCLGVFFVLQNGKHQQISGRLQDVQSRKQIQKSELDVLDRKCDSGIMEIKQLQQQLQVGHVFNLKWCLVSKEWDGMKQVSFLSERLLNCNNGKRMTGLVFQFKQTPTNSWNFPILCHLT